MLYGMSHPGTRKANILQPVVFIVLVIRIQHRTSGFTLSVSCIISSIILNFLFFSLFFKDFIYLFTIDIERQRHRQREKQVPCREPDVRLDPGTSGLHPGPKVRCAKLLSHPGIPCISVLIHFALFVYHFQLITFYCKLFGVSKSCSSPNVQQEKLQ